MTTDTGYPLGTLSWSRRRQELEAEGYELREPETAAAGRDRLAVALSSCGRCKNEELDYRPYQLFRRSGLFERERGPFIAVAVCGRCGWYLEF